MKQKDKIDMERQRLIKAVRSAVRLKHSFNADAEINEVLPKIVSEFDNAVGAGKPFELELSSVFEEHK